MDRRRFLLTSLAGALAAPVAAGAQQAGQVSRVGILVHGRRTTADEQARSPFRLALRDLGWVEGRNVAFEYRASTAIGDLAPLASELANLKVDVLYAVSGPAAHAAKQATGNIPIVMLAGGDPVSGGLVASLPRPGGNVTGVTAINTEVVGHRLGLIRQIIPRATRLASMWNRANIGNVEGESELTRVAATVGVTILSLPVAKPEEIEGVFIRMTTERVDALWVHSDGMLLAHRRRLAELAAKHRLPSFSSIRELAEAGILMTYSADWSALARRAAGYVDKILKGAKPADLPVEQPTKFELVINLKTAKALNLTIPPSLLLRADQVIE